MLRSLTYWIALLGALGCAKSEPVAVPRAASEPNSSDPAIAPIQPKLTDVLADEPTIKFETVEAEIAYWQARGIKEVKKRFEKLTEAEVQKIFDELSPHEQANIRRIRTWLPHKRISEMGNVAEDVQTLTSFPTQFDPELALNRLLELADDSGAPLLIKKLGIKSPRAIVEFRMEFGQISPDTQTLIWGINQKIRTEGIESLAPSELAIVRARPGLFPSP
jgi:hypothetical protein